MGFENVLKLIGGLALFLYGMSMMSSGLEAIAGDKLKKILERLTSNRFLGVLVGTGITAAVQSSSATTVMVVGFVNAGIMTLIQATWIIMGANIGTNITSQLIALDVGKLAPILALLGVVFIVFLRSKKIHHAGQIIAGLGILFIGMTMMSQSMSPLRDDAAFLELMTQFGNPFLGILVGALFTAVIQSSSASVGILQALAASGLIGLPNAVYVLFGQNIGTCVTALIASMGSSRNAKRAALIHLTFNLIGTAAFFILVRLTDIEGLFMRLTPDRSVAQIANFHLFFNIGTMLLLLPFGKLLVRFVSRILPDRPGELEEGQHLRYLDRAILKNEYPIGSIAIFIIQLRLEIERMLGMARDNIERSFRAVKSNSEKLQIEVERVEDYIDYLNKEISYFISHMIAMEMTETESVAINAYFKITGNIERIGDHAINIAGYANLLESKGLKLSDKAQAEVDIMRDMCLEALDLLYATNDRSVEELLAQMQETEQEMDDITAQFRGKQIERLMAGDCNGEACVIYTEMLTDFERLGDHMLNIAQAVSNSQIDELRKPQNGKDPVPDEKVGAESKT
ncbi:MAG: Na/Pi cotransporter family protein [Oscillospiraceae bacterium]|nr:Na/Pi cotransporter family protein [Clostridiales bacterium]MDD4096427.1 Na/Pi cotransporter family protein [Oscillospiraceae bacterium]